MKNPIDRVQEQIAQKYCSVEKYRPLFEKLQKLSFEGFDVDWSVGYQQGTIQGLLLCVRNVKDMIKFRALVAKICGFMECKVEMIDDYAELNRRSFHLDNDVVVMAFLPYEKGSKCEFVRVGEKMEPVYELQCDGVTIKENENDPPKN